MWLEVFEREIKVVLIQREGKKKLTRQKVPEKNLEGRKRIRSRAQGVKELVFSGPQYKEDLKIRQRRKLVDLK